MQKMYQLFESRGSKIYRYNGDYVFSSFSFNSGQSVVKLHLEGALGISPGIVADYSLFHGYEFGFVDAAQFIDLKALLDVKITQEMYCPVFSLEVAIPKLGAVRVGIYLVLNVDGDITLTVRAEEGVIASASVYGSTRFGIPTSFHLNKGFDSFSGAECDPMTVPLFDYWMDWKSCQVSSASASGLSPARHRARSSGCSRRRAS